MKKFILAIIAISLALSLFAAGEADGGMDLKPVKVLMKTTQGDITLELYPGAAPVTVENFLNYVKEGFYDGLVFHRVINDFMVQGGGFDLEHNQKAPTQDPIINEADNGLKNSLGTIAMARTNNPNSATCQFFINVKDNSFLDHTAKTSRGFGYCVFGKVVEGMDVVNQIKVVKTGRDAKKGMGDWPVEDISIISASIIK